jgi:hypothetical protein
MIRVYINDFAAERIWQTDSGDAMQNETWDGVQILCEAYTMRDLNKRGSKTEPCCWIECRGSITPAKSLFGKYAVIA